MALNWVTALSAIMQLGVGIYSQIEANNQQKKADKAQAAALKALQKTNVTSAAETTARTASTIADSTSAKKTIGSLRMPLEKTTNTKNTGLNISETTTGLNIPL